ncbi:TetR/AcrR family transcriptional regulator [Microbacterium sp. A93]|uniref:TetR/AcrR family transcriptional regulator n=1 Tax=Microbacterium sp. A93 TaxID=3450716 RepID=UPI003F437DB0
MAKPKGEDVRRDVILATFACVARNGVPGTSMRDIARSTGLSTGTITYHFGSRHNLLLESIDYGYWRVPTNLESMAPHDAMRRVLNRYELRDEPRQIWWQYWLAMTSYAQSNAEAAQRLVKHHNWVLERWELCLNRGKSTGEFFPSVDPASEARRLAAFAHGLAIQQLIDPLSADWAADELSRAVDALRPATSSSGVELDRLATQSGESGTS